MSQHTINRQLIALVLVVLVALLVLPLLFMGGGMMGYGSPTMGGMWGGGMRQAGQVPGWFLLVAVLLRLVFLLALVGAGYLLYRAVTGSGGTDPAIAELRAAYARGELTDEEFERRREKLERDA